MNVKTKLVAEVTFKYKVLGEGIHGTFYEEKEYLFYDKIKSFIIINS